MIRTVDDLLKEMRERQGAFISHSIPCLSYERFSLISEDGWVDRIHKRAARSVIRKGLVERFDDGSYFDVLRTKYRLKAEGKK